jgi:hypothetical protein
MDHPTKTAACPLYFRSNGGQFTPLGLPIVGGRALLRENEQVEVDAEGNPLYIEEHRVFQELLCGQAFDCLSCDLLQQWIAGEVDKGWTPSWECFICLDESWRYEKDNPRVERNIAGFYHAGRDPSLAPGDEDYDPDKRLLPGCMSCGRGSSLLQLVLRRAR